MANISQQEFLKGGSFKTVSQQDFLSGGGFKVVTDEQKPIKQSIGLRRAAELTTGKGVEITKGIFKGGLSTARGAGRLLGSITGGQLVPEEKPEIFKPQNRLQEIGFFGEQIAEFFLPGGAATKLSKVGKLGALGGKLGKATRLGVRAGTEAGLIGGQTAVQTGEFGEEARAGAGIGAVVPIIGPITKGAFGLTSRLFKSFSKNIAGAITGKGVDVIEQVIAKPEQARVGLRGDEVKVIENVATKILQGVKNIKQSASNAYAKALEELPQRLGRNPKVLTEGQKTTIKVDGETFVLTMKGLKDKVTSSLRKFGVDVNRTKKEFDFIQSPFVDSEEKLLKKAFELIDNWKDTTPKGFNDLAIKISKFRKSGTASKEFNNVIDDLSRQARSYISDRVPAVGKLNAQFEKEQDFLEVLIKELSIPSGKISPQAIKQVAGKIDKLFNSNKALSRSFIEQLEKREGIDILATEAGRQLGQAPSRAAVSIGDTIRTLVNTIITPKSIGELAALTGIASQKLEPVLQQIKKLPINERNTVITILEILFR